jgi:hypothetical protein
MMELKWLTLKPMGLLYTQILMTTTRVRLKNRLTCNPKTKVPRLNTKYTNRIVELEQINQFLAKELEAHFVDCGLTHKSDQADMGMALARAGGIDRGNEEGVKERLHSDDFDRAVIERLMENPFFERDLLEAPRRRKKSDDNTWFEKHKAVKIGRVKDVRCR